MTGSCFCIIDLQVSLVKILIENFPKIFEEDNSTLYKDVHRSVENIKNSCDLQTAIDKSCDKTDANDESEKNFPNDNNKELTLTSLPTQEDIPTGNRKL